MDSNDQVVTTTLPESTIDPKIAEVDAALHARNYEIPRVTGEIPGDREGLKELRKAERNVIIGIMNLLPQRKEALATKYGVFIPQDTEVSRLGVLFALIESLTSTEDAYNIMFVYGLVDGICHSNRDIANFLTGIERPTPKEGNSIRESRTVVIQTLWELFGKQIDNKIIGDRNLEYFHKQYIEHPDARSQRVMRGAECNLQYHRDRLELLAKEDELLNILTTFGTSAASDYFAQYYRLGKYKYSFSGHIVRSRVGVTVEFSEVMERTEKDRFLDKGRCIAEYLIDGRENLGTRVWADRRHNTNIRSKKEKFFDSFILREIEEKRDIIKIKPDEILYMRQLNVWERLLGHFVVTQMLLGNDKKRGLDLFLERFALLFDPRITNITQNVADTIVQKILGKVDSTRLVNHSRVIEARLLLSNTQLLEELRTVLSRIAEEYHLPNSEGVYIGTFKLADELELRGNAFQLLRIHIDRLFDIARGEKGIIRHGKVGIVDIQKEFGQNGIVWNYFLDVIRLAAQFDFEGKKPKFNATQITRCLDTALRIQEERNEPTTPSDKARILDIAIAQLPEVTTNEPDSNLSRYAPDALSLVWDFISDIARKYNYEGFEKVMLSLEQEKQELQERMKQEM